jgi:tetratricopeptide (TPR) repeat protein
MALRDALMKMRDVEFVGMEDWGASSEAPMDFCLDRVSESDLYVGIFGGRYGWVDPDSNRSITELEYRRAASENKPCLIYVQETDPAAEADPRLQALKDELLKSRMVVFFGTPQELATRVTIDIHNSVKARKGDGWTWLHKRFVGWAVAAMAILVAAALVWSYFGVGQLRGVAVLPFNSISNDGEAQALGLGLATAASSHLSAQEAFQKAFWVVPAADVVQTKARTTQEARQAFGVNLVVAGMVDLQPGHVRVTATVNDAKRGRQLRSRQVTQATGDPVTLQDQVVRSIAELLELDLPHARTGSADFAAEGDYLRGRGFLEGGYDRADAAIAAFSSALARDPKFAQAHAGLGQAYLNKFLYSRQPSWLEKAKSSCREAERLGGRTPDVLATLGGIAGAEGRGEEAVTLLRQVVAAEPYNHAAWNRLGKQHEALRRLKEAEQAFRKAIDLQPQYAGGHRGLGVFLYGQGRYSEAARSFERAREIAPDNYRTYSRLGSAYFQLGHVEEAEKAMKQSIALKPNAVGYSSLCALSMFRERYAEAAALCEKGLQFGTASASGVGNTAVAYRLSGNEEKAQALFHRAIELARGELKVNPRNAESQAELAWLLAHTGDRAGAEQQIEAARESAPGDASVLFGSLVVYELLGQRERALAIFQALRKMNSFLEEIRARPELKSLRTDKRFKEIENGRSHH